MWRVRLVSYFQCLKHRAPVRITERARLYYCDRWRAIVSIPARPSTALLSGRKGNATIFAYSQTAQQSCGLFFFCAGIEYVNYCVNGISFEKFFHGKAMYAEIGEIKKQAATS